MRGQSFPNNTIGYWIWQGIASLFLGLTAILSLPLIYGDLGGERGALNWFTIFAGTFIAAFLFWWLLITRPRQVTPLRGVLAAILAALLAFPLVFSAMFVLLGEVPLAFNAQSMAEQFAYAALVGFFALCFGGWFTVLVGATAGGLLAYSQRRLLVTMQKNAAPIILEQRERAQHLVQNHPWLAATGVIVSLLSLVILAIGAWVWFAPLNINGLTHVSKPSTTYAEAVAAIERLAEDERAGGVNPLCESKLLGQGERVKGVIIFIHGFTNCPEQFATLGKEFFDAGYNVFIPRMPHHGLSDRLTTDLSKLSTEELVEFGGEVADIAQGLGEDVTIVGLSGGGAVTAWLAQTRPDVDKAVLIAPMLGIMKLPEFTVKPVANAALTLPNFFIWWDADAKDNRAGPPYAYNRYATRAAGALMRMSALIERLAAVEPPQVKHIVAVSNEVDAAVNNAVLSDVVDQWRKWGVEIETYEFPGDMNLPHDLIDPHQPDQQIDVAYPILKKLIISAEQ